jgi:7-carboxy-7-deazaguanine synthase (Cx14CxxC type)
MAYKIKEIYYTLQGEGFHAGRPAVFCRFAGCNLWSGREEDRDNAVCKFCDTDFWGTDGIEGGRYELDELIRKLQSIWKGNGNGKIFIVFTGGEPALQLDQKLVDACHQHEMEIAIETNGTIALPDGIDWVTVSPKAHTEIVVKNGNELKLVHPQKGIHPDFFEKLPFSHFYLQPMDNSDRIENTHECIKYCLHHPIWKLSIQTHKYIGIP